MMDREPLLGGDDHGAGTMRDASLTGYSHRPTHGGSGDVHDDYYEDYHGDHGERIRPSYQFGGGRSEGRRGGRGGRGGRGRARVSGQSYATHRPARLRPGDEAGFRAGGIMLYRRVRLENAEEEGGAQSRTGSGRNDEIAFLCGVEHRKLAALGGKRESEDGSSIDTALREFSEETGGLLGLVGRQADNWRGRGNNAPKGMEPPVERFGRLMRRAATEARAGDRDTQENNNGGGAAEVTLGPLNVVDSTDAVHALWIPDGKYVLYLINTDMLPDLHTTLFRLPKRYQHWMRRRWWLLPDGSEMQSLKWVGAHTVRDMLADDRENESGSRWSLRWGSWGSETLRVHSFLRKIWTTSAFQDWLRTQTETNTMPGHAVQLLQLNDDDEDEDADADDDDDNDYDDGLDNGTQTFNGQGRGPEDRSGHQYGVHAVGRSGAPGPREAWGEGGTRPGSGPGHAPRRLEGQPDGRALEQLRARIQASRNAAVQERLDILDDIPNYQTPKPKPKTQTLRMPTDIVPLQKDSAEFAQVRDILPADRRGAVQVIKKVQVDERRTRYNQWRSQLPADIRNEVRVLHGTPKTQNAPLIARNGPRIDLAGTSSGKAYGAGFYTHDPSVNATVSSGYAGANGSILVCMASPGRTTPNGSSNTTVSTLQSMNPPAHTVHVPQNGYYVLFNPDSVVVTHILDIGTDTSQDAARHLEMQRRQAELERALVKWEKEEAVRTTKLDELQGRLRQIDFFHYASQVLEAEAQLPGQFEASRRLYDIEKTQFERKLPVYAHKRKIVPLLCTKQAVVLQGGTGIGKTILLPQFMYDEVFARRGMPEKNVAVLVPRRAIAKGLASYVAQLRGCTVGEEVGFGVGNEVSMGPNTRICFMTYAFFQGLSMRDTPAAQEHMGEDGHEEKKEDNGRRRRRRGDDSSASASDKRRPFGNWDAVIIDEAHERQVVVDILVPSLISACTTRADLRIVVMSATMDSDQFTDKFQAAGVSVAGVSVPGVTHPVEEVYMDTAWDSTVDGAHANLALEIMKIFNAEETGNMLVFMSKTADVYAMVDATHDLTHHHPRVSVLPLHAGLSKFDQEAVVKFDERHSARQRMICFATNIAEAGITIPGITAVVDTGKQLRVEYEHASRRSRVTETWISKSSQQQRRGRAGRTQPGTCYYMYPEDTLNEQEEFGEPEIANINLDRPYLTLVASGHKPETFDLLTKPLPEAFRAAKRDLAHLGALKDPNADMLVASVVGHKMLRLSVSLPMARAIIEGSRTRPCVAQQLVIIAAMMQESRRVFPRGERGDFAKAQFRVASGDHETLLHVYEEYTKRNRDPMWARANGLSERALARVTDKITLLYRDMQNAGLVMDGCPPNTRGRSEAILQALCVAFFHNVAVPNNPTALRDGFTLVEHFEDKPVQVLLHPSSSLSLEQRVDPVNLVLFDSHTFTGSKAFVATVTIVKQEMVERAAANWSQAVSFPRTMDMMQRTELRIDLPSTKFAKLLRTNLSTLRWEFPHATFYVSGLRDGSRQAGATGNGVHGPGRHHGAPDEPTLSGGRGRSRHQAPNAGAQEELQLVVSCLESQRRLIDDRVQGMLVVLNEVTVKISAPKDKIRQFEPRLVATQKQLKDQFGAFVTITLNKNWASREESEVFVKTLQTVAGYVHLEMYRILGMQPPDAVAAATPGAAGSGSASATPRRPTAAVSEEQHRISMCTSSTWDERSIFRQLGKTREAIMVAFAHYITCNNNPTEAEGMFVYGGFVRDYVFRGDLHAQCDLDLAVKPGTSPKETFAKIKPWTVRHGLTLVKELDRGSVLSCQFRLEDDSKTDIEVEFVDADRFRQQDGRIDFDVNNLKLVPRDAGSGPTAGLAFKYDGITTRSGPLSLPTLMQNCRDKRAVVIKANSEIQARIKKMNDRGWSLVFPPGQSS